MRSIGSFYSRLRFDPDGSEGVEPVRPRHWSKGELDLWPFWARLCILPIVIVACPVMVPFIMVKELYHELGAKAWIFLYYPIVIVLIPIQFLIPDSARLFYPLIRPMKREIAMRELIHEAFSHGGPIMFR
ncbi:MAG: hypothetical protein M3R08_02850 [Bacteroidota bacterium]|nr:hypothetical protein [Bacteroidota bacterium]